MSHTVLDDVVAGRAPTPLLLSVEQYHQMIQTGVLRDGEPVELIDGLLIRKDRADRGGDPMSHGPNHALGIKLFQDALAPVRNFNCHLQSQLPVTLPALHEPEPDLSVVRGAARDYRGRHPGPADVLAIVEVSDSSLEYDRTTKQRVYAKAGIAVYCIANLPDRQVEVYEEPDSDTGRYETCTVYKPGQSLQLRLSPTEAIDVAVTDVLAGVELPEKG